MFNLQHFQSRKVGENRLWDLIDEIFLESPINKDKITLSNEKLIENK